MAFGVFYRRHVDRVIDFAARRLREPADVADLTSNTFIALLTGARSFDPERGEPVAWLIGIAARQISNFQRRRRRETAAQRRLAGHRHLGADDYARLEERIDAAHASARLDLGLPGLHRFGEGDEVLSAVLRGQPVAPSPAQSSSATWLSSRPGVRR
jgi:RNA polymerase sigma-70 factor (ECF subfamily)